MKLMASKLVAGSASLIGSSSSSTSSSAEPSTSGNFVLPPQIKNFKWRDQDDGVTQRNKKRMSVEIKRQIFVGALNPGLYPKDYILECDDELTDEYLPKECRGKLWLKLVYDAHEECMAVGLVKLRFVQQRLDDSAPDVVVAFTLLPHERRQFQSRVYESTTNRDFSGDDDECFVFHVPKTLQSASDWALRVQLFDDAKLKASTTPSPIGAATLLLGPVVVAMLENQQHQVGPPQHSGHVSVTVKCIDLRQMTAGRENYVSTATVVSHRVKNNTRCSSTSSPTPSGSQTPVNNAGTGTSPNSPNLMKKLMSLNQAFHLSLSRGSAHQLHEGTLSLSFNLHFSDAGNRLSLSVHDFFFNCNAASTQSGQTAEQSAAAIHEDHVGLEAYAKVTLFEQAKSEMKNKRTRTVKVEQLSVATPTDGEQFQSVIRFTELLVLKDIPTAEYLLNNCALRIEIVKPSLVTRDKPISRSVIGSAIFCRGKELAIWNEIVADQEAEQRTVQIRLNAVLEQD